MSNIILKDYSETVPIQYEEGKALFMGMDIMVDPRVLIPRPETEVLVSRTAELCARAEKSAPYILDLCTGSGAVALGLKKVMENSRVIAADISEDAIDVAKDTISLFSQDIDLVVSDLFSAFTSGFAGKFDCIVSNPPYVSEADYKKVDAWVKAEPRIALWAGEEGMDVLDIIIAKSPRFLASGGFLAVEIGYDQADKVKDRFIRAGFSRVEGVEDFNGVERVMTGWKNG